MLECGIRAGGRNKKSTLDVAHEVSTSKWVSYSYFQTFFASGERDFFSLLRSVCVSVCECLSRLNGKSSCQGIS